MRSAQAQWILPGWTAWFQHSRTPEATRLSMVQRQPMGRLGQPEEIAKAFRLIVEKAHSISDEELLTIVAGSFGLQRVTENIRDVLQSQLKKLIASGSLNLDGSAVSMPR